MALSAPTCAKKRKPVQKYSESGAAVTEKTASDLSEGKIMF